MHRVNINDPKKKGSDENEILQEEAIEKTNMIHFNMLFISNLKNPAQQSFIAQITQ